MSKSRMEAQGIKRAFCSELCGMLVGRADPLDAPQACDSELTAAEAKGSNDALSICQSHVFNRGMLASVI